MRTKLVDNCYGLAVNTPPFTTSLCGDLAKKQGGRTSAPLERLISLGLTERETQVAHLDWREAKENYEIGVISGMIAIKKALVARLWRCALAASPGHTPLPPQEIRIGKF